MEYEHFTLCHNQITAMTLMAGTETPVNHKIYCEILPTSCLFDHLFTMSHCHLSSLIYKKMFTQKQFPAVYPQTHVQPLQTDFALVHVNGAIDILSTKLKPDFVSIACTVS